MSIGRWCGYPPHVLISKVVGRLRREIRQQLERMRDGLRGSHETGTDTLTPVSLALSPSDIPENLCSYLAEVAPAYLAHRFDLLGSGWVQVAHGVQCEGFEGRRFPAAPCVAADPGGRWLEGRLNRSNVAESMRVWSLIGRPDYKPIDWQLDFRSGYRWSEKTFHCDIRIGPAPGADIKLPRELARMQHLPQLALCAMRAASGDDRFASRQVYIGEIRAQLLDFIATNPPRYGVNWACAMDVAIRVANWLLSLDLLATIGISLDQPAQDVVARSVAEHAAYVAENLEWSEAHRTNHYLADLVGLLYSGARLGRSLRSDAWLALAVAELNAEAVVQFHAEGSCYEGSTSYHRLSAELLLFALALGAGLSAAKKAALVDYRPRAIRVRPRFRGLPLPLFPNASGLQSPFAPAVVERVWRAARFSAAVTRPDNRICQIGDTDSGRLFSLHPVARGGTPPRRDELDHRAFVEAVDALFADSDAPRWFDTVVIRAMVGGWRGDVPKACPPMADRGDPEEIESWLRELPERQRRVRRFPVGSSGEPWRREAFPEFGLYLFRRTADFVAFRCAAMPAAGVPTGHMHDDNLGLELMLDRRLVVFDPGTYVYTADREVRNQYRSAAAHDVPRGVGWAVAPPGRSPFKLRQRAEAECICWCPGAVAGRVKAPEATVVRLLRLGDGVLEVWDGISAGELAPLRASVPLCEGYGRKT